VGATAGAGPDRPRRGAVKQTVIRVITESGMVGLTANEVFDAVVAAGVNTDIGTVRTSLYSQKRDGTMVRSEADKRWRLVRAFAAPAPNDADLDRTAAPADPAESDLVGDAKPIDEKKPFHSVSP
jgi:hypothetical protein